MTPAAAKLLMCVCAGSTGAVMVPAVHKARAALHHPSAQHASAHTAVAPGNSMASPCAPVASAAPLLAPVGAMPAQPGLGDLGQLADNSPGGPNANGVGFAGGGYGPSYGGDGGYLGGGGPGIGGIGGGGPGGAGGPGGGRPSGAGPGGSIPGGPVVTPVSGTVPEPASWAMLVTGFGAMGGAVRWQRRATA